MSSDRMKGWFICIFLATVLLLGLALVLPEIIEIGPIKETTGIIKYTDSRGCNQSVCCGMYILNEDDYLVRTLSMQKYCTAPFSIGNRVRFAYRRNLYGKTTILEGSIKSEAR